MSWDVDSLYEFRVKGVCHDQSVMNVVHYRATAGVATMEDACQALLEEWREFIIANLCDEFRVLQYELLEIEGVIWKVWPASRVPTGGTPGYWPYVSPLLRYEDSATIAGDAVDDKGTITTAMLPSFCAIGAKKACGPLVDRLGRTWALERKMRGGIRISGIPEAVSDDGTGNELNAASITTWEAAFEGIRAPAAGGITAIMGVISLFKDSKPRAWPTEGTVPTYGYADVNTLSLEPYITSQVSRKQRSSQLS